MNTQASKKANALAAAGGIKINPIKIKYLTLDDLDGLVSDQPYQAKQIAGVAESLFKKPEWNFQTQCCIALSSNDLKTFLTNPALPDVKESPILVGYCKNDGQWVTFCITHFKNQVTILYKDSLGDTIPSEIVEPIAQSFEKVTGTVHHNRELEDINSSGVMALRNMEIIIRGLAKDKKRFISDFANVTFCSEEEIETCKMDFREYVRNHIHHTCGVIADRISNNKEYAGKITKLVSSCVDCIKLLDDIKEYSQTLRDEDDKCEEVLQEMRDKIMNHEQTISWLNQPLAIEIRERDGQRNADLTHENVLFKTKLQRDCAEETKEFTKLFTLLGAFKHRSYNQEEIDLRKNVSKKLNINDDDVDRLRQELQIGLVKKSVAIKPKEVVEPIDIDSTKLADSHRQAVDLSKKSTDQILAEMDKESSKDKNISTLGLQEGQGSFLDMNAKVSMLKEKYDKVKKYYDKEWHKKEVKQIKTWARGHRGHLSDEDLYEVVAVMDRANELVTGHFLRDTQILAVLDSLNCTDRKGKLCQIATGEGKTVIVSLIAAIKVLQGKQVDVITSNEVLAEEGVNTRDSFFGVLGISVAHNNPDEKYRRGPRKCYTADVVYGSMGSFQFDYLKDSFEGLETRGSRRFEFVILDEVDSLLLDNGGHIAKLAEPFPGFDSLKYVYIKIWQELFKAEQELVIECEEGLKRKAQELTKRNLSADGEGLEEELSRFIFEQHERLDENMTSRIKKSDPANIDLIPFHLREFARDMVDSWIKNAIYAKYSCHENEQYVVRKLGDASEPKIVPVDYQGTGVTLHNTMWSNGLHQFVQLKHNLQLTSETMTSSLISNIGYVKLYDNNIFGLTGTLGSTAEQKLLSEVYDVSYSKIPTYKAKVFEEICGKVIADDQFKKSVVDDVLKLTSKNRSVLIICSTINEALGLEKKIKKSGQVDLSKISTYFDETNSKVVQQVIDVGEIIISTNIAGRGSDFKTTSELEANGGLEVRLCFLPVNQRVEDQAFGRTSRQGNKGTAQIVVRESEVQGLGFMVEEGSTFREIKELRDLREAARLSHIREVELAEISFYDGIFGLFSNLYKNVGTIEKKQPSMLYLLKDLKEFWAFWLHKKQKENVALATVHNEFEKFEHEARNILGEKKGRSYGGGKISHNPYYGIQQAEFFIKNNRFKMADECLNHAITLSKPTDKAVNADCDLLMYPAHIKMFEVRIEQGSAVMKRIHDLMKERLHIRNGNSSLVARDDYKIEAKNALESAKKGLIGEITYIKKNFTDFNASDDLPTNATINQDFLNILGTDSENIFWDHIRSRVTILMTILEHIKRLLIIIDDSIKNKTAIALGSKVSEYWDRKNICSDQKELGELMDVDELHELSLRGLGTMYVLKVVPNVFDGKLIAPAFSQIAVGIAAFATGLAFTPSFPIMSKIAEAFVVEGLGDLVIAIATLKPAVFNIKRKLVRYGIQVISIGVFALFKYTKIAQHTIRVLQSLKTYLEKCPVLKGLCEYLTPIITDIIFQLQNVITEISIQEVVGVSMKAVSTGIVSGTSCVLKMLVHKKMTGRIMQLLQPKFVENVTVTLSGEIKLELLRNVDKDTVLQRLSEVLESTSRTLLEDVVKLFAEFGKSKESGSDVFESVLLKGCLYAKEVCSCLIDRLEKRSEKGRDCFNGEELFDDNCKAVANKIASLLCSHTRKQLKKVESTVYLVKLLLIISGQPNESRNLWKGNPIEF